MAEQNDDTPTTDATTGSAHERYDRPTARFGISGQISARDREYAEGQGHANEWFASYTQ